jgi:WD40 repeat protein
MAKVVRWAAGLCAVVAILIGAIYGERVITAWRWERWHQKRSDAQATWAVQKRAAESARDVWQIASAKSRGEDFLKAFDRRAWHLIASLAAFANTSLQAGDCELAEQKYEETTDLLAQLVKSAADCKRTIRLAKSYGVLQVAFSPDGKTLVSIASYSSSSFRGQRVMLWNVDTGEALWAIRSGAFRVAFSPDGKMIAMGGSGSNSTVSMWNAQTGHLIRSTRGYVGDGSYDRIVPKFVFSLDGRTLVTADRSGTMKFWSTATGDCIRTFKGHDAWYVSAIIIRPDDGTLITTANSGNIRFWNPATGDLIRTVKGGPGWGSAYAVMSPNGKFFVTGGPREITKIWNAATGEYLRTLESEKAINAAAFSPDGSVFVTGGEDTTVKLWNPATGDCIRTIEGHAYPVTTVAFSFDGKTVASGSKDRTIKLWNVEMDPADPAAFPSADRLLRAKAQTAGDLWAAVLKEKLGEGSLSDCVGKDWDKVRAGMTAAEAAMQNGDYVRAEREYREAIRLLKAAASSE